MKLPPIRKVIGLIIMFLLSIFGALCSAIAVAILLPLLWTMDVHAAETLMDPVFRVSFAVMAIVWMVSWTKAL